MTTTTPPLSSSPRRQSWGLLVTFLLLFGMHRMFLDSVETKIDKRQTQHLEKKQPASSSSSTATPESLTATATTASSPATRESVTASTASTAAAATTTTTTTTTSDSKKMGSSSDLKKTGSAAKKNPPIYTYDVSPVSYAPYKASGGIPRVIYIFWDSGWPTKTTRPNLARRSWEFMNPDYEVKNLDTQQVELLTNRSQYVADNIWKHLKIQAKSDVYRTLLLFLHGGFWVDASTVCNQPLDDWINLKETDLISFLRNDNKKQGLRTDTWPWITSWFLASPKGSYMIRRIVDVIRVQTDPLFFRNPYHWWHHIVSQLSKQDEYIHDRIYNAEKFKNADPMHCGADDWETKAVVLKRCGLKHMYAAFATTQVCCSEETDSSHHLLNGDSVGGAVATAPAFAVLQNLTSSHASHEWKQEHCPTWNCHNNANNLHRVQDMTNLYGAEVYPDIPNLLYMKLL